MLKAVSWIKSHFFKEFVGLLCLAALGLILVVAGRDKGEKSSQTR